MKKTNKKNCKRKWITALCLIPVFVGLGFLLLSGGNLEIIKSVITGNLSGYAAQDRLHDMGIRGYITVSVLAALQVVLTFLPAEPVQVLSGLAFGFPTGLFLCTVGVVVGNTAIFLLYKKYGAGLREYFDRKFEFELGECVPMGKLTFIIFLLYFLPAIPYGLICLFAAIMGMKFPRYIVTTLLGSIPSVVIGVGLGHVAMHSSWLVSLFVLLLLLSLLTPILVYRDALIAKVNAYMKKHTLPHSSKAEAKPYSRHKLTFLYVCSRILFFFRGVKVKYIRTVKKPDMPCIVLSNHGAFGDFAYTGSLLRKYSPHFIVARMYFFRRDLKKVVTSVGCFPKSMFTLDVESAKNCLRVIKSGRILAMMPEARLSTVGEFEDIQPETFSFLKKMALPIYVAKIGGDYLASPKWGNGMRRGSYVEAELYQLFTAEELATLSVAEVEKRVTDALYYDEFKWLEAHPNVKYRSKRIAEGLENILTLCPACGKQHTVRTHKNRVYCSACGLSTKIDGRYAFDQGFLFRNFKEWYGYQTAKYKEMLDSDPDFALASRVTLKHASIDGKSFLRTAGEGVCTLDRTGLLYEGSEDGKEIKKHFPIKQIYRLLFGAGENFEVYEGKEIWYFAPEIPQSSVNFYIFSKLIYDSTVGVRQEKEHEEKQFV